jgi:hypothetical protein
MQVRASPARLLGHTQATRRTLPLTRHALTAEAPYQHRVFGEGGRRVDQAVEDLVVAGRRHVERVPDRTLFRAALLPPAALEREDLTFSIR